MGVLDKMMEFMMPKMMKAMPRMMANIKPEDMEKMMGSMHEMMEHSFENMDGQEVEAMIHDMMPKMMDGCFSKMTQAQRTGMLSMCRDMLNEIEQKYAQPPA